MSIGGQALRVATSVAVMRSRATLLMVAGADMVATCQSTRRIDPPLVGRVAGSQAFWRGGGWKLLAWRVKAERMQVDHLSVRLAWAARVGCG